MLSENHCPAEEAVPSVKQENWDEAQILESQHVQVKKEDPELPITLGDMGAVESHRDNSSIATETSHKDTEMHHMDTGIATEMRREDTGAVQTWTVPLSEEMEAEDGNTVQYLRVVSRFKKSVPKIQACRVCKKKFKRGCDLNRHEKIHTGVKPYSCPTCDRRFIGKKYVEVHMRLHTGELPFSCPQCENKRFATKGGLNLHVRTIHSQDRPFSCTVCESAFKTKGHLKEHMLRHTEIRPLTCPDCGKGYWRRCRLQAHQAKCTKDKDNQNHKTFDNNDSQTAEKSH